jgi:NADP-dependent 3-hydroxy acid dehydrogenase YdfG
VLLKLNWDADKLKNHVEGKSIIITGAGGGFGALVSQKAAAMGAKVSCVDINGEAAESIVASICAAGGEAQAVTADVIDALQMRGVAKAAVDAFGSIDVMINNAGVMPLSYISDHEVALPKWHQCIDINFKGVVNGTAAVYDQMMAQGCGHVINLSSIYGNHPMVGSAVYGATKAAVNYFSESLRVEARGKIKVTIVKPTAVLATGLSAGVLNPAAAGGSVGHNIEEFGALIQAFVAGDSPASAHDPGDIGYQIMDPEHIADSIIYTINQPWGVSIGDITIRAAGDHYIL